jgi:nitrogen fixation protein FixH
MDNEIRFNSNSLNLFDFTNNGVFFTATFDIVGSGDTSIDMNVEVLTATTANDYEELNGAPVVQLVYKDEIDSDKFAFTSEGVVTTPVTNEVSLTGDIDLALAETAEGVFSAETKLAQGTYNFKVNNNGTELGNGTACTDEMSNVTYKSSWKSATPFTATGGTYTFTFDTNTNKLTVERQAEGVSVVGDINLQLTETADGVYSAETKLSQGTYNFKINNNGTEYGKGTAYTDTITNVVYKTSWKSATPFTATGGTYTFTFDTNTNKLTVERQAEGVSVIGDINLQLTETADGVYSAETKLAQGTYNFKINNFGTEYGKGTAYTDTITNVVYKTAWKSATPFTATGGTYTFTFDTNTNKVTVVKK